MPTIEIPDPMMEALEKKPAEPDPA